MDLIKKTLILTNGGAHGYLSIIKVGGDVGLKIVGENFSSGMRAGVKIGSNEPFFFLLDGTRTEKTLPNTPFRQTDGISCVIADENGLVARGGNGLRLKEVTDRFLKNEPGPSVMTEPTPQQTEEDKEELLNRLRAKDGAEYYGSIKESLEELLIIYPKEEALNNIFPNSEWVKINYEEDDYYVVGKIKEQDRPVLIGYGVPGKKNLAPPKIADELFTWLTVNDMDKYDGYWMLFQDANSGEVWHSPQGT